MEYESSYNKRLRKKITARAVINEKNRMVKVDIGKNIEEIRDVDIEIKRNKELYLKESKNIEIVVIFL